MGAQERRAPADLACADGLKLRSEHVGVVARRILPLSKGRHRIAIAGGGILALATRLAKLRRSFPTTTA
jgi:hypothetical protein